MTHRGRCRKSQRLVHVAQVGTGPHLHRSEEPQPQAPPLPSRLPLQLGSSR